MEQSIELRLTKAVNGKLFTTDFNLARVAELQSVACVNITELATRMKPVVMAGDIFPLKITREGKDKGQAVGYLNDGTMVVVNHAAPMIGQQVEVQIQSSLQTGAGIILFGDVRRAHDTTFLSKEK